MNAHADINFIRDVAAMIRDMLGGDFDEQTFIDTLEGETDVMEAIGHLIERRVEANAQAAAMKEVAKVYTARAQRFEAQANACTKGLGKLLDATGEHKVQHPLGTVSRTKPRAKVEITDEHDVPMQLCKHTPDSAAIKKQLEAGEDVPGARIIYGDPGISVRQK